MSICRRVAWNATCLVSFSSIPHLSLHFALVTVAIVIEFLKSSCLVCAMCEIFTKLPFFRLTAVNLDHCVSNVFVVEIIW